jgi:biopolymer transport protein ExbB/TolQ
MEFNLDMFSFWQQGDAVSHAVLILLVLMSITSWAIILSKSVQLAWWQHANGGALDRFWQAQSIGSRCAGIEAHVAVSVCWWNTVMTRYNIIKAIMLVCRRILMRNCH